MTACKKLPYGDAEMRPLLMEQVDHIVDALPDGMTFDDWYDDACSFEPFDFGDDTQREAVSFAYGYLRGAHEAIGCTMMELLDEHGIDPEQCGTRTNLGHRPRKPRKKGRVKRK